MFPTARPNHASTLNSASNPRRISCCPPEATFFSSLLEWRLLDPQRLAKLMDQLLERREEWNERRRGHITELRKRSAEAEAKLKRIYEAIENGVVNVADPSLKDRISAPALSVPSAPAVARTLGGASEGPM
jgi:hypothetical protein